MVVPASKSLNVVLLSLTNMRTAKTQLLPSSMNFSNAAAMAFQIRLRDTVLCDIRRVRVNLKARMLHGNLENWTAATVCRERRRRGAKPVATKTKSSRIAVSHE